MRAPQLLPMVSLVSFISQCTSYPLSQTLQPRSASSANLVSFTPSFEIASTPRRFASKLLWNPTQSHSMALCDNENGSFLQTQTTSPNPIITLQINSHRDPQTTARQNIYQASTHMSSFLLFVTFSRTSNLRIQMFVITPTRTIVRHCCWRIFFITRLHTMALEQLINW